MNNKIKESYNSSCCNEQVQNRKTQQLLEADGYKDKAILIGTIFVSVSVMTAMYTGRNLFIALIGSTVVFLAGLLICFGRYFFSSSKKTFSEEKKKLERKPLSLLLKRH